MKYLSREDRDKIADVLVSEHNGWVQYCNEQDPHPAKGVHIKRCVAENKIKEMRRLIGLIAPKKLVEKTKEGAKPAGQPKKTTTKRTKSCSKTS